MVKVNVQVALCMGSACFARGNRRLLDALEEAIDRNGWRDVVTLSGSRCENCCGSGPNIRIDGTPHREMDEPAALALIAEKLAALN